MCGENSSFLSASLPMMGSPPHVRGKHRHRRSESMGSRITPACAGKTAFLVSFLFGTWDHPRMCGENPAFQVWQGWLLGSPPHVRGKLVMATLLMWALRITPACAGKTKWQTKKLGNHGDHPRMCGENLENRSIVCKSAGSPPHVRGKHGADGVAGKDGGITPACAGKTQC